MPNFGATSTHSARSRHDSGRRAEHRVEAGEFSRFPSCFPSARRQCHRRLETHDGIGLVCRPSARTRMRFYPFSPAHIFRRVKQLQVGSAARGATKSNSHQRPPEYFRSPRVTQPRLLLVDDEEIFVRGLSRELSRLGWQVQTADNTESALRALRQSEFEALVLDQELPGTRGIEVLTELGRVLARPVAVLLSGHLSVATTVR